MVNQQGSGRPSKSWWSPGPQLHCTHKGVQDMLIPRRPHSCPTPLCRPLNAGWQPPSRAIGCVGLAARQPRNPKTPRGRDTALRKPRPPSWKGRAASPGKGATPRRSDRQDNTALSREAPKVAVKQGGGIRGRSEGEKQQPGTLKVGDGADGLQHALGRPAAPPAGRVGSPSTLGRCCCLVPARNSPNTRLTSMQADPAQTRHRTRGAHGRARCRNTYHPCRQGAALQVAAALGKGKEGWHQGIALFPPFSLRDQVRRTLGIMPNEARPRGVELPDKNKHGIGRIGSTVLSVDGIGAFDTVSRQAMLHALRHVAKDKAWATASAPARVDKPKRCAKERATRRRKKSLTTIPRTRPLVCAPAPGRARRLVAYARAAAKEMRADHRARYAAAHEACTSSGTERARARASVRPQRSSGHQLQVRQRQGGSDETKGCHGSLPRRGAGKPAPWPASCQPQAARPPREEGHWRQPRCACHQGCRHARSSLCGWSAWRRPHDRRGRWRAQGARPATAGRQTGGKQSDGHRARLELSRTNTRQTQKARGDAGAGGGARERAGAQATTPGK